MNLFAFDDEILSQGYRSIAGIDEAGRGCLAGPVVAACVSFRDNVFIEGIKDSKELTPEQRESFFEKIISNAFVGIGIIDVELIDRINILEATRLAMSLAYKNLGRNVEFLLIDAVYLPDLKIPQKAIIKGDQKSASIAAASIVAKVTRDRIMRQYHEKYYQYGFDRHKGYATKEHLRALKKFGPCPIHRKSFSPVRELMLF
ncbi:MAG: ribonuclease HII [Thermodesulfovibrio sp.]|jgi:ribonuclease HII|uniref:Ribonuclease HII n=2 Tax=Thermodesulfovibrio TaxID=28261 RepID=A0A2J6WQI3_9BACT|nr:MAG: ribonuclease HII [Thermodesulfovibrio aggregans]